MLEFVRFAMHICIHCYLNSTVHVHFFFHFFFAEFVARSHMLNGCEITACRIQTMNQSHVIVVGSHQLVRLPIFHSFGYFGEYHWIGFDAFMQFHQINFNICQSRVLGLPDRQKVSDES